MVSRLHGNGFISNSRFPNGSPFATALALKILVMSGKAHKQKGLLYAVVSWLLRKQKEDGSWESSAVLRVPAARITDPSSFHKWNSGTGANWGTITLDPHAIFTTATVVSALGLIGLKTILP
ncbi:hypothetical protein JZU71_04125, partial [bacterium]|nr:hypothetical protein [bacterium]